MLNQFEVSLAVKSYCLGESGFQKEKKDFFFLAQKGEGEVVQILFGRFYRKAFLEITLEKVDIWHMAVVIYCKIHMYFNYRSFKLILN